MASIDELREASQRRGSFRQTVGAVLWSFFGVRKGRAHDQDMAKLNPVHVVVVGVAAGVFFVVGLATLVTVITS
jgi:hypothetical protein